MQDYILGIDLGPNSIGWALISEARKEIIDLGVRVFPEGVDKFDTSKEVSRNAARRTARGTRRQTHRRRARKRALQRALVEAGLFPVEFPAQQALLDRDPYELRSRALCEKLTLHELGRVFYHLAQRRGFKSNRKKDRSDKEVKGILAEMSQLDTDITNNGFQTLGQFLNEKNTHFDRSDRTEEDHVRKRHTRRAMYETEFEAIWTAQQQLGHGDVLSERLKYGEVGRQSYPLRPISHPVGLSLLDAFGIHGILFFQRKMYWPRSVVGLCELEPKEPRCPKGHRHAQKFRALQEINNLRYIDPDSEEEMTLDKNQRALLLSQLAQSEKVTFDQIRRVLGFLDNVKFNLERGKRATLQGLLVDCGIRKILGVSWDALSEDDKDAVVETLINNEREDDRVVAMFVERFAFTRAQAEALLDVDLPAGYLNVSLKAIDKLLPHLEKGLIFQSVNDPKASALHAAGYLRRDELKRRLFDRLPAPGRTSNSPIGNLPNPVVRRTISELRKVINAILREYGKPSAIHVEMGRDVKTRPAKGTMAYQRYMDNLNEMRARETRRDSAADKLRELGVTVNRENINRYLLWDDQKGICVYTGKAISPTKLFRSGDVAVDHILPYSHCLDDSQNNKVVCLNSANVEKGDRTPYQWLSGSDPQRYEKVCHAARNLFDSNGISYQKYRRFLQKELELDGFISRQLNDTRYIARVTVEFLKCLMDADHKVLGVRGQLTAELRHQWGIDTLLAELPDSPAWHEKNNLRPGEKNRADHRHHAIDAVVIALTSRKRLQDFAANYTRQRTARSKAATHAPWPTFRDDLMEKIRSVNVSHRAVRKVRGKLHEDSIYGKTEKPNVWVIRKPLCEFTANDIENIRDEGIKRIVIARLNEKGVTYGRAVKVKDKVVQDALVGLCMPSGVPIKKVRLVKRDATIRAIRQNSGNEVFVKPGKTHHICLFEFMDGEKLARDLVSVTMIEAMNRLRDAKKGRAQIPVINREHPTRPDAKFIMSLSRGEMVLAEIDGVEQLMVYRTAKSTTQQMSFIGHTDARDDAKAYEPRPNTLKGRKVVVDLLGRIRTVNGATGE